jgi:hypothetical protein
MILLPLMLFYCIIFTIREERQGVSNSSPLIGLSGGPFHEPPRSQEEVVPKTALSRVHLRRPRCPLGDSSRCRSRTRDTRTAPQENVRRAREVGPQPRRRRYHHLHTHLHDGWSEDEDRVAGDVPAPGDGTNARDRKCPARRHHRFPSRHGVCGPEWDREHLPGGKGDDLFAPWQLDRRPRHQLLVGTVADPRRQDPSPGASHRDESQDHGQLDVREDQAPARSHRLTALSRRPPPCTIIGAGWRQSILLLTFIDTYAIVRICRSSLAGPFYPIDLGGSHAGWNSP